MKPFVEFIINQLEKRYIVFKTNSYAIGCTQSMQFHTKYAISHKVCNFTQSVQFHTKCATEDFEVVYVHFMHIENILFFKLSYYNLFFFILLLTSIILCVIISSKAKRFAFEEKEDIYGYN